jgi:DNA processing protein
MIDRYAAALCSLADLGPQRLRLLLQDDNAEQMWHRLIDGDDLVAFLRSRGADRLGSGNELLTRWRLAARAMGREPAAPIGVDGVVDWHHPCYPAVLRSDVAPPAVVWWNGSPAVLAHRRVAIVGTRRATALGRSIANELAAGLARAGVAVVSGLALGIDGAAHRGALAAGGPVVAVVGSGLDVVYPTTHRSLWGQVVERGMVISQSPLGAGAEKWRFPLRNRILAALSEVVVVVESDATGGSMSTVAASIERGITVMAVPGSLANPVARGSNGLLADGCPMVRDVTDILVALGLSTSAAAATPAPLDGPAGVVMAELGSGPATVDELTVATGLSLATIAVAIADLVHLGRVADRGAWVEAR